MNVLDRLLYVFDIIFVYEYLDSVHNKNTKKQIKKPYLGALLVAYSKVVYVMSVLLCILFTMIHISISPKNPRESFLFFKNDYNIGLQHYLFVQAISCLILCLIYYAGRRDIRIINTYINDEVKIKRESLFIGVAIISIAFVVIGYFLIVSDYNFRISDSECKALYNTYTLVEPKIITGNTDLVGIYPG